MNGVTKFRSSARHRLAGTSVGEAGRGGRIVAAVAAGAADGSALGLVGVVGRVEVAGAAQSAG